MYPVCQFAYFSAAPWDTGSYGQTCKICPVLLALNKSVSFQAILLGVLLWVFWGRLGKEVFCLFCFAFFCVFNNNKSWINLPHTKPKQREKAFENHLWKEPAAKGRKYLPQQLEEHIRLTGLTFYHHRKPLFHLAVVCCATKQVQTTPCWPALMLGTSLHQRSVNLQSQEIYGIPELLWQKKWADAT